MSAPYARIESVESGDSARGTWIAAWIFLAVSLGAFLVAVFAGKGWVGPVVAGLLAMFALGWALSLWRTSGSLARHGKASLELAAPAVPGGALQGTVHFEKGVGRLARLVATLECRLWTWEGATTTKLWSARQVVEVVRDGEAAEARVRFDLPGEVPNTRLPPALRPEDHRSFHGKRVRTAEEYFVWELAVSSGMHGHDVDRSFRVPVGIDAKRPDGSGRAAGERAPQAPAPKLKLFPLIALVAANLVPVAGVVYFGWKVRDIVLLYWAENLVIGAYNVLRILSIAPHPPDAEHDPDAEGRDLKSRAGLAAFFLVHYGGFCAGHGLFLTLLFSDQRVIDLLSTHDSLFASAASHLVDALGSMARDPALGFALVALVASHGISFALNHFVRGERHRLDPGLASMRPYGRIVVTHAAILAGAGALMQMKEPMAALLVFIGLKILLDLGSHYWEHSGRRAGAAPA